MIGTPPGAYYPVGAAAGGDRQSARGTRGWGTACFSMTAAPEIQNRCPDGSPGVRGRDPGELWPLSFSGKWRAAGTTGHQICAKVHRGPLLLKYDGHAICAPIRRTVFRLNSKTPAGYSACGCSLLFCFVPRYILYNV